MCKGHHLIVSREIPNTNLRPKDSGLCISPRQKDGCILIRWRSVLTMCSLNDPVCQTASDPVLRLVELNVRMFKFVMQFN